MLKKIKILLFITITALVLPGMVHADMSAYNNVCISPGSPCAGRIADLENQYGKHMARIADLENQYGKHMARIADLEAQLAAPAGPSPELLAAQSDSGFGSTVSSTHSGTNSLCSHPG